MYIQVMKSKIHRVTVTDANLNYIGSITIDQDLMDAAGIIEGERVYIVDVNNGERLDTYTIAGERGSGTICLNGPQPARSRWVTSSSSWPMPSSPPRKAASSSRRLSSPTPPPTASSRKRNNYF